MSVPTNWTTVPVAGKYIDPVGNPIVDANVIFTPQFTRGVDPAEKTVVLGRSIVVPLVEGICLVNLLATDDPDGETDFTWEVREDFVNGEIYNISVPMSAKDTGLDLSLVGPADPGMSPNTVMLSRQELTGLVNMAIAAAETSTAGAVSASASAGLAELIVGLPSEAAAQAYNIENNAEVQAAVEAIAAALIRPTDAVFRPLDMLRSRVVNVGYAGDSTGSPFATGAAESAWKESLAAIWPERPARVMRWDKFAETLTETVWEDGSTVAQPAYVETDALVGTHSFSGASAEIVDQTPDVGANLFAGTANAFRSNNGELVAKVPSYTEDGGSGIPAVGWPVLPRANKSISLTGEWRISSIEAVNKQRRILVNADTQVGATCIRLNVTGSTAMTCSLQMLIANTLTTLGTFPAGTIPASTPAAWYAFTVEIVDNGASDATISATLNGQTVSATATPSQLASMGSYISLQDPGSGAGLRNPVALGDVYHEAVVGGPSDLSYFTLYNGNVQGATADWQRTRAAAMYPQPLDMLVIHHGHNYSEETTATQMLDNFELLIETLAAQQPNHPFTVVIESENPRFNADKIEIHAERQEALREWAVANGYAYVPIWEAYVSRPDQGESLLSPSDGIHPIVGVGTTFQKNVVKAWIAGQTLRPGA